MSLSAACGANCIYCPVRDRDKKVAISMPYELAKKIIDEVASDAFKAKHKVQRFNLSENGDGLLNKDFLKICRYLKSVLPDVKTEICANFQKIDEKMATAIVTEGLIDEITCNIDGFNDDFYFKVKRLDYQRSIKNILNFLKIRNAHNKQIRVNVLVLTLYQYISAVQKAFGVRPARIKDIELDDISDDFPLVRQQIEELFKAGLFKAGLDTAARSPVVGWSERKVAPPVTDFSQYSCPRFSRVLHEAFIAPDGVWYACCLDNDNEINLGNLKTHTLEEIYFGDTRKQFVRHLRDKAYDKIGGPCQSVHCCQDI